VSDEKGSAFRIGHHVEFAVCPKEGDHLQVENQSAKNHLKKNAYWTVVNVCHYVDLDPNKDESEPRVNPTVELRVVVHPRKFTAAAQRRWEKINGVESEPRTKKKKAS